MRFNRLFLVLGLILIAGVQSARSEDMNPSARNLLIDKFKKVIMNLAPSDPQRVPVTLRLADLLSERARLAAMTELEKGCSVCTSGNEDRKAALKYYEAVLPKVAPERAGIVLFQVAHLYDLMGDTNRAISYYEKIVADNRDGAAEALAALGDIGFKRRQYEKARGYYERSFARKDAPKKGYLEYRIGWCHFNEGHERPALEVFNRILTNRGLLNYTSSNGVQSVDRQFHEEVARDYATVLSRTNVAEKDIDRLYELSPETTRLDNIFYLGGELERLGNKPAAIIAIQKYQAKQRKPDLRLEGHIRLAQAYLDLKKYEDFQREFEGALGLFAGIGMKTEQTSELKSRIRNLVTVWYKAQKENPQPELFLAFTAYLGTFKTDADMTTWAAQIARQQKKWNESLNLYRQAIDVTLKNAPAVNGKVTIEVKSLEVLLLAEIEVAELSKDAGLRDTAYAHYLSFLPNTTKATEVRYQKAHLLYEKEQYAAASTDFRSLALSANANKDIRKKAADLALDSLVLAKNEGAIETWALEFGETLKDNRAEYRAVARKAQLNKVAQILNNEKAQASEAAQAGAILAKIDLNGADEKEKIAYWKDRLLVAEKQARYKDVRDAADHLLAMSSLSTENMEYALARKGWVAELTLDFKTAFQTAEKLQKMSTSNKESEEDRLLRMALLAELSDQNSEPFYQQLVTKTSDAPRARAFALKLVKESKDQQKEFAKYQQVLIKDPELYSRMQLEFFAETGDVSIIKKTLENADVAKTPAALVLKKQPLFDDYKKMRAKLASSDLQAKNDRELGRKMKARVEALTEAEKLAAKAVEIGDWTGQLVTLNLVAAESERFYQEIFGLPIPQGLAPEQEQEYLQLLSQQAAPYQEKAKAVREKLNEFWSNQTAGTKLLADYQAASPQLRRVFGREVELIAQVAPEAQKNFWTTAFYVPEKPVETVGVEVVESARRLVIEDPMNRQKITALLEVEKKAGKTAMVAYLEGRLKTLEGK